MLNVRLSVCACRYDDGELEQVSLENDVRAMSDILEEIDAGDGVGTEKVDRQKKVSNHSEKLKRTETLPQMRRSATGWAAAAHTQTHTHTHRHTDTHTHRFSHWASEAPACPRVG